MIDFRYHLISLIAVFLALGLGILMGSVVLDEQLVNRLESRVGDLRESLGEHRAELDDLRARIESFQEYAAATEPELTAGVLLEEQVVTVAFEGTEGSTVDAMVESIETAGGTVAARLTLTERFALGDQTERDQLALILRSTVGEGPALREEAARELGGRIAAAAARRDLPRGAFSPEERVEQLITDLQEAEFLGVSRTSPNQTIPPGALVLVVGGGPDAPRWKIPDMGVALANAVADRGVPVVAAEPSGSAWGFVAAFRSDGKASAQVTTVDNAETFPNRVALPLALGLTGDGSTGHFGTDPDASTLLPEPSPSI